MLWLRGGFPCSFLAVNDGASFAWRNDFLRSFSERDFGTLGLGATPASLGGRRVGFEYKVGDAPKLTRSMAVARHDLDLHRLFVVAPVAKPYTLAAGIDVAPLADAIDAASSGKSRRPTD